MNAVDRLALAVLAAADAGEPAPCHGRSEWLSDSAEDREAAAWRCGRCRLLDLCINAADELGATSGVWAGIDRGRSRTKARRSA